MFGARLLPSFVHAKAMPMNKFDIKHSDLLVSTGLKPWEKPRQVGGAITLTESITSVNVRIPVCHSETVDLTLTSTPTIVETHQDTTTWGKSPLELHAKFLRRDGWIVTMFDLTADVLRVEFSVPSNHIFALAVARQFTNDHYIRPIPVSAVVTNRYTGEIARLAYICDGRREYVTRAVDESLDYGHDRTRFASVDPIPAEGEII